ncbi:hypothetical protein Ddc_17994 [Ditylenchus destructor]|nr:hypothetical protein Ddc_17994 [Ditylenchus destructor]
MSVFYALIISYPLFKVVDIFLMDEPSEGWDQELIDIAYHTTRMLILMLLHKTAPHLSVMDVLSLAYPLRRLWEVILQKKPRNPWKMELYALVKDNMFNFLIEIFFRKALFQLDYLDSVWWRIFFLCTCISSKIFFFLLLQIQADRWIQVP